MPCTRVGRAIICNFSEGFVDMSPYGAKVWMEWHRYLGPCFWRSQNSMNELRPGKKCWKAYEAWRKENPLK